MGKGSFGCLFSCRDFLQGVSTMSRSDDDDVISRILETCRTIAVVGLSADPARDSHEVAHYLQSHGYRIVPINPAYAGSSILGERCYATLYDAAAELSKEGTHIDLVDCFRRPDAIEAIAEAAIAIDAQCLWMQLGVVNEAAAAKARAAGIAVVMDRCLKIEHAYR
jgi:predicted CoA-binding protein